jgi:ribosome-associated protein
LPLYRRKRERISFLLTSEICGENPYHHEGFQALQWVLIDYVNVVVHVMQPDTRKFYKLEDMWSDATAIEYDE